MILAYLQTKRYKSKKGISDEKKWDEKNQLDHRFGPDRDGRMFAKRRELRDIITAGSALVRNEKNNKKTRIIVKANV